jgi:hypothetical protein
MNHGASRHSAVDAWQGRRCMAERTCGRADMLHTGGAERGAVGAEADMWGCGGSSQHGIGREARSGGVMALFRGGRVRCSR